MRVSIAILVAVAATPAPVPGAGLRDSAGAAMRAVAARDAAAIAARFAVIAEQPSDRSSLLYISAEQALAALAGCRAGSVDPRENEDQVHFACPGRPRAGCDSGDITLRLVRTEWEERFILRHERSGSPACAIVVAPPPPPGSHPRR